MSSLKIIAIIDSVDLMILDELVQKTLIVFVNHGTVTSRSTGKSTGTVRAPSSVGSAKQNGV